MAKALEDTCFYRYNCLLSLNEVGGDPRQFGVTVSAFHHLMQERAKSWPGALSPLATHDTKRGADMRARLNVLSEVAPEWNQRVRRWASLNRFKRGKVAGAPAPSPNDEYAIYQTMLGAWPTEFTGVAAPDSVEIELFRRRLQDTMLKSIREAKRRTSWINPNDAYETACLHFVDRLLQIDRPNPFLDDFVAFQQRVARLGVLNSISQTVLALTAPGVPDIYQGGDLWDLNMIDPDNRRPVDFDLRQRMLAEVRPTPPGAGSGLPTGRTAGSSSRSPPPCSAAGASMSRAVRAAAAMNRSHRRSAIAPHLIGFRRRDGSKHLHRHRGAAVRAPDGRAGELRRRRDLGRGRALDAAAMHRSA